MRCINVGDGSSVYIVLNMITLHCSVVGKLRVWGGNASRVFNNEGCKDCFTVWCFIDRLFNRFSELLIYYELFSVFESQVSRFSTLSSMVFSARTVINFCNFERERERAV